MSRKDYIKTAEAIREHRNEHRVAYKSDGAVFVLARTLAEVFKADNARFDFVRFFTACGMNEDGTDWAI